MDIRAYLRVLRARKWTILFAMVVVAGAAAGFSARQSPVYSASSRVYVQALASEQLTPYGRVDIITQSEVAASEPVAARVAEDIGYDGTPAQLLAGLDAVAVTETQILTLNYSSGDPELAAEAANSFAENFLVFRSERERESVLKDQQAIESRVQTASSQLARITQELEQARADGDVALASTLDTQRNILIARLGVLQQRLDDVQSGAAGQSGGQVIQEATVPTEPVSPNVKRNAALGVVLGLAAGVALAFLRDRLDDRFRGREDVEKAVGAAVLGTIPRYSLPKDEGPGGVISLIDSRSVAAEAYRGLRTNLQFIASQRGMKSIVVTSPSAGEGKSATSANLAVVLAQAGRRVIVVSADLRRPTLARYFGIEDLEESAGLSGFLSRERQSPVEVLRDPGIPNLRVVPSGVVPPNPAELLSTPRFRQFLRFLEEASDFVIVDSPPVLAVADAAVIAGDAGGALLVIDSGATHRSSTVHSTQELRRTGGFLVGCVMNNFDTGTQPYYYGPYSYAGYGEDADGSNGGKPGSKSRRRARAASKQAS